MSKLKDKQNDFINYLNQNKITFDLMYQDGKIYGFLLQKNGYYNIKLKFKQNRPALYISTQDYYINDDLNEFYLIINKIHTLFLGGK